MKGLVLGSVALIAISVSISAHAADVRFTSDNGLRVGNCRSSVRCHKQTFSRYRNKNNFIAFGSLDGSSRFPMLRLAMAVAALLPAATYAQAQTAKHSFSGLCAITQAGAEVLLRRIKHCRLGLAFALLTRKLIAA
jgi:hypothetical protein